MLLPFEPIHHKLHHYPPIRPATPSHPLTELGRKAARGLPSSWTTITTTGGFDHHIVNHLLPLPLDHLLLIRNHPKTTPLHSASYTLSLSLESTQNRGENGQTRRPQSTATRRWISLHHSPSLLLLELHPFDRLPPSPVLPFIEIARISLAASCYHNSTQQPPLLLLRIFGHLHLLLTSSSPLSRSKCEEARYRRSSLLPLKHRRTPP